MEDTNMKKKEYIQPTAEEIRIETMKMLAASDTLDLKIDEEEDNIDKLI